MFHVEVIKDGDVTKVQKEILVDGQMYVDETPREGSANLVTSGGVNKAIGDTKESVDEDVQDLQEQIDDIAEKAGSGYTPKGEASVATLNALSGQENGELYTMTDAGTLTDGSLAVVAGDTVAWDATNEVWYKAMDYAPRQYGTNEVHNLPTTITAFRTGDYIVVDGTDTAKMGKDDLLKETAENGRNPCSMGYVDTTSDAESAFGNDRDVSDATPNTMWAVKTASVIGLPAGVSTGGILVTLRGNTTGVSVSQIWFDKGGSIYTRTNYAKGTFTAWKKDVTISDVNTIVNTALTNYIPTSSLENLLCAKGYVSDATSATNAFGSDKDVKEAAPNTMWNVLASAVVGLPSGETSNAGMLVTIRGGVTGVSRCQFYLTKTNGHMWHRIKWGSEPDFTAWAEFDESLLANYIPTSDRENITYAKGYVYDATSATNAFGSDKDVKEAAPNTMWNILQSAVVGLPGSDNAGMLVTIRGGVVGTSRCQLYFAHHGKIWHRIRWGSDPDFTAWKEITTEGQNVSHILPLFLKIGACGGSLTTGASFYKDSNNVVHGVDNADFSWIQIWARERGVQAFNFSHGGYSTKTWLTDADGLTKAQQAGNECKAYFILFGGNDITAYDGLTNLGTIADVHVGSEDTNPATYYGNYSRMIADLKTIGGQRTKIFAFTYALAFNSNALMPTYNQATKDVCNAYNDVFVIDIENDPVINGDTLNAQKYSNHYTAYGYKLIADRLEYLVDKYVEEHPSNFRDIQFIGTNYDIVEC